MNERRQEIFANRDGTISVKTYVGNGHGVHTNMFPVRYEEMIDIPNDIYFRTNRCIVSSAYCRLQKEGIALAKGRVTFDQVLDRIQRSLLLKKRQGLCHSELATKDSVLTFLKYVKTSEVIDNLRVFNFEKLLEFEKEKTESKISSKEENDIVPKM